MTRNRATRKLLTQGLAIIALLALVAVAVPLLAVAAFSARLVAIAALPAAAVALALSPRLRAWLSLEPDPLASSYKGLRLPRGVACHPQHSWARRPGRSHVTVGVDDLMQGAIGPLEEVGLPRVGREVRQGAPLAALRSGGRAVVIKAPVSGTVVEVNRAVQERPNLVNESPYADGWLVRLRRSGPRAERRALRRHQWARTWFRGEVDRLIAALAPASAAPVAQDGGALVPGFHAAIDDETWPLVREAFFGDGL